MKASNGQVRPNYWWLVVAVVLGITAVAVLLVRPAQDVDGKNTVATYAQGVLHVNIPYNAAQSGAGKLTVEVVNPENEIVGRAEKYVEVSAGNGHWLEEVRLDKPLALDEVIWHLVRYRFDYNDGKNAELQGTESISQILRTPVVHILGQQAYLSGGQAAVRVIVTDSRNEIIGGNGAVRIELTAPPMKPRTLYSGKLNKRGTTEAQFTFPASMVGNFSLRYVVDTAIGSTEFTQPVRLEDKVSILLTTEKPIYQPGQTIHVRSLALDRANHEAAAGKKLTFEVEDSRGNKVFKKATETDKFGVASAEFALADEVNLGTYHLRALMGEADAPTNTAELALNVEKYVLPKFKLAVEFGEKNAKAKRGYRPGDHVKGTVQANYFFGKPVDGGEISVKASSADVAVFEVGTVQGKTDGDGAYHFDLKLPNYFAGKPLSHGAARVLIEATVKDAAGHSETRGEPITVSESPLLITAVPEGGTLVPNLENQVFVLTSYPDGTPASAEVTVRAAGNDEQRVATDEGGVAIVRVKAGYGNEALQITAKDKEGNQASNSLSLQSRVGEDQILLRTERAVYRAGDRIHLRVFSTKQRGTAYVDVVKEGQTVLTRDIDIENGQAELTLTATPQMAGTVDFSAYLFGRDARPVGDHRLVFVQPADELKIEATANAQVYKPGDDARIQFRVTNGRGEGVSAALGLQVVDEAVFALAEKQPGFAKVFFYLEQEVMKPRYEIHAIGMPEIAEPVEDSKALQKDLAARALFSATEMVRANKFETEFGRTLPQEKYGEFPQRYQKGFSARVHQLTEKWGQEHAGNPGQGDLATFGERMTREGKPEIRDPWGTSMRVERLNWGTPNSHYVVQSAGPDKQFGTGDDFRLVLEVRKRKLVGKANSGPSKIDVTYEKDRGAFNGLAEIVGTAMDQSGGALEGATLQLSEFATGKMRTARVNPNGDFRLSAVPPGMYHATVFSDAKRVTRDVMIEERDRVVMSVMLQREMADETVVAVDEPTKTIHAVKEQQGFGFAGGVPGGAMGGVVGGVIAEDRADVALNGRAFQQLALAAPAPMPAPHVMQKVQVTAQSVMVDSATVVKDEKESAAPRVRSYFPEALYINPEIITDKDGRASITIPMADSITTWRMAMLASTVHGALGSGTSSLKVFQDFFVDLDLPVTLTQGDRVSIPVAVYNYSNSPGDVDLKLQAEDWYSLVDDTADKSVAVEASKVGGAQFILEAKRIGKFKLTLSAKMNGKAKRADIVVREIEVIPNGREQDVVFNGRLENVAQHEVNFPAESIPEASKIFVRLYPGPLSQVVEGMDSLLRMPYGCFEQTSSSTYPNVLALDYMKRTKKLTPEVHAKAEGFIANGYQRLLTFEVRGGGFSWFGEAPANKILTAYGLMEFSDMSKVHDVDPNLIARTQQWLAAQQQADGSWKPDTNFINEGATNRFNTDVLRITAYLAWALENTSYQGPAVDHAKQYIEGHLSEKADAYTLAVLANFAVDYGKDREFTRQTMQMLLDARTEKDDKVWWTANETGVYATGESASVETTGLATQALLKWGGAAGTVRKAMTYITAKKDAAGTWGTTQATIMALRALLLATEKGAADVHGTLEVLVNGKSAEKLTLTPANNDLLHQFVFKGSDLKDANSVEIRFEGKGGLAYQVVGSYFLPWDKKPETEALSIDVAYDRTHLAQDDIATATATVRNNLPQMAKMVMVDLGIPPGFDLLSEDLQAYQEKSAGMKGGKLEKFSQTATQAILYFDAFAPGQTVTLKFRLRAKYPIRAKTFASRVYEYYDPAVKSVARPVELEVRGR
jgi:hypothetical protein